MGLIRLWQLNTNLLLLDPSHKSQPTTFQLSCRYYGRRFICADCAQRIRELYRSGSYNHCPEAERRQEATFGHLPKRESSWFTPTLYPIQMGDRKSESICKMWRGQEQEQIRQGPGHQNRNRSWKAGGTVAGYSIHERYREIHSAGMHLTRETKVGDLGASLPSGESTITLSSGGRML